MNETTKWIRVGDKWINLSAIACVTMDGDASVDILTANGFHFHAPATDAREILAHIGAMASTIEPKPLSEWEKTLMGGHGGYKGLVQSPVDPPSKPEAIDHAKYNGDWVDPTHETKGIITYLDGDSRERIGHEAPFIIGPAWTRRMINAGVLVRYGPKPAKEEAAGLEPGIYLDKEFRSLFRVASDQTEVFGHNTGAWIKSDWTPKDMLSRWNRGEFFHVPMEGE